MAISTIKADAFKAGETLSLSPFGMFGRTISARNGGVFYLDLGKPIADGVNVTVHINSGNIYSGAQSASIPSQTLTTMNVVRPKGQVRLQASFSGAFTNQGVIVADDLSGTVAFT